MTDKFYAELVTRSEIDRPASRLEISLCDGAGRLQTLSMSSEAVAALAAILCNLPAASAENHHMAKRPERFAVGVGCHEPLVLVRFEDEPAYALKAEQAAELGTALLTEADAMKYAKCLLKH